MRVMRLERPATAEERPLVPAAARIPVRGEVEAYRLEQANDALLRVNHGQVRGAAVLEIC